MVNRIYEELPSHSANHFTIGITTILPTLV